VTPANHLQAAGFNRRLVSSAFIRRGSNGGPFGDGPSAIRTRSCPSAPPAQSRPAGCIVISLPILPRTTTGHLPRRCVTSAPGGPQGWERDAGAPRATPAAGTSAGMPPLPRFRPRAGVRLPASAPGAPAGGRAKRGDRWSASFPLARRRDAGFHGVVPALLFDRRGEPRPPRPSFRGDMLKHHPSPGCAFSLHDF
jgi:hypothetical protein